MERNWKTALWRLFWYSGKERSSLFTGAVGGRNERKFESMPKDVESRLFLALDSRRARIQRDYGNGLKGTLGSGNQISGGTLSVFCSLQGVVVVQG